MRSQTLTAAAAALLLCSACEDKPAGRKLASGIAQRITVAPGAVAFLLDASHPDDRTVPDDLLIGELYAAKLEGSDAARKIGRGVANTPGSFAFSRQGEAVAFLSAWRFRAGQGELWLAAPGGEAEQVAAEASAFAWSPAAPVLAYVTPGHLGIKRGKEGQIIPVEGIHAVVWSPDGKRIAARASASAGGKVWIVDAGTGEKKEIAPGTSDLAFAADGTLAVLGPPPPKGGDRPLLVVENGAQRELARATSFAFSPDGKEVALLSTQKDPGEATGDLSRVPRAGGTPQPLGSKVAEWRYAADGSLVYLARYDLRARAGALTVAAPGAPPRELAPKVQGFILEGKRILWLVPAPKKGDFKIELWASELSPGAAARKIDEGVYGWQVAPDGKTLFYKARCAGGPRSCSLLRLALDGALSEPEFLVANVAGFDLSHDGSRVLLEQPHRGATRAVDLAAIGTSGTPPKTVKPFAMEADASSRFVDPSGKRVVYATLTSGKAGVYVADVP